MDESNGIINSMIMKSMSTKLEAFSWYHKMYDHEIHDQQHFRGILKWLWSWSSWFFWFLWKKSAAEIPGLAAGIHGLAAEISGQHFGAKLAMLNISFRSRVFSTDTLMDGEAVIGTHDYENMDEK